MLQHKKPLKQKRNKHKDILPKWFHETSQVDIDTEEQDDVSKEFQEMLEELRKSKKINKNDK